MILRYVEVEANRREATRLSADVIERDLLNVRVTGAVNGEPGDGAANLTQHGAHCRIRRAELQCCRKIRACSACGCRQAEHVNRAKFSATRGNASCLRICRRSVIGGCVETEDARLRFRTKNVARAESLFRQAILFVVDEEEGSVFAAEQFRN